MNYSDVEQLKKEIDYFASSIDSIVDLCDNTTITGASWAPIIRKLISIRQNLESVSEQIDAAVSEVKKQDQVGAS